MRYTTNTITRRTQDAQDKVIETDEQIERLEDDIRRLKIDFDIYFNGGTKAPPHQARASLEARTSRLNGNRDLSFAQRYKLNTLISRYTSYRELWRRRLKAKGDDTV
jgi:hypothetical protein